eukprot:scaffold640_cov166-Amphora_coffeaeformis.AAC.5
MAFDDHTANSTEASYVGMDLPAATTTAPQRGTRMSQWFSCCFPKHQENDQKKNRDLTPIKGELEYEEDPDATDNGMVYFDLPNLDEEEAESSANTKTKTVQAPPFVAEFWRFLFSILLLDWLRQNKETTKRIKHE